MGGKSFLQLILPFKKNQCKTHLQLILPFKVNVKLHFQLIATNNFSVNVRAFVKKKIYIYIYNLKSTYTV